MSYPPSHLLAKMVDAFFETSEGDIRINETRETSLNCTEAISLSVRGPRGGPSTHTTFISRSSPPLSQEGGNSKKFRRPSYPYQVPFPVRNEGANPQNKGRKNPHPPLARTRISGFALQEDPRRSFLVGYRINKNHQALLGLLAFSENVLRRNGGEG